MTVDDLIETLHEASAAGYGGYQVAVQDALVYRRVDAVQMTKTIYKAQNPTGILEPFLALITNPPGAPHAAK